MKEYTVVINGLEHTMLLEEEDQKRRFPQAKATGNTKAEAIPEHPYQAAAAKAKADDDTSETESKEADKPANKSGTAANK